jgi:hypothetical protein
MIRTPTLRRRGVGLTVHFRRARHASEPDNLFLPSLFRSCFVLDCFCENLEAEHIAAYMGTIMGKLGMLSSNPNPGVRLHLYRLLMCCALPSYCVHCFHGALRTQDLVCHVLPDSRDGHRCHWLACYFFCSRVCSVLRRRVCRPVGGSSERQP